MVWEDGGGNPASYPIPFAAEKVTSLYSKWIGLFLNSWWENLIGVEMKNPAFISF